MFSNPAVNAGLTYVDRGDRAVEDFVLENFICNNQWHTLTLPSFVPLNAKLVSIIVYGKATAEDIRFQVCPATYTDRWGAFWIKTANAGSDIHNVFTLPLLDGRDIQYKISSSMDTAAELSVAGWWI